MRVLIVDDSVVTRLLLRTVLESEGCQVREASSGAQALKMLLGYTPDIVTMDVHMPGMDGYETTERILAQHALPVVILTASANPYASETAMHALEVGALAVLEKPTSPDSPDFNQRIDELLRTLRSLAQVKIVRRPRKNGGARGKPQALPQLVGEARKSPPQLVAIAASAGGPVALKALLQGLKVPCPWPLVLVQHIAAGFLQSFRDWLASVSGLPVAIAEDGQTLAPGVLYLAPDGFHLGFSASRRVVLHDGAPENHIRPSANHLFRSVAQQFGQQAIGIQLSGMGHDGAEGMLGLRHAGALTIAQEPSSAMIDSMPLAAIGLQAAQQVLAPEGIASLLNALAVQQAAVQQVASQDARGRRE
ncbi:MAG: chemotaxis protein CheB [Pseudomonas sp.]